MLFREKIFKLLLLGGKQKVYFLLTLSILSGIIDTLGVVSIMPFMTIVANPEIIQSNDYLNFLFTNFEFTSNKSFITFLGSLTFIILMTSMIVKALNTFNTYKFVLNCEGRLSQLIFSRFVNLSYSSFLAKEKSQIEKQILSESTIVANNGVLPLITIFSQGFIVFLIISLLMWVDYKLAMISGGVLSLTYIIIFKRNSKILKRIGKKRIQANEHRFKLVSEALNNIRDIKLGGYEIRFDEDYIKYSTDYVNYQATSSILATIPRFLVEGLAFGGMISIVIYLNFTKSNFGEIIPVVSLYALAGYRLMPALQQIYASSSQLKFVASSINELHPDIFVDDKNISRTIRKKDPLSFNSEIKLVVKNFNYAGHEMPILKNISFSIRKNDMIGIIGPSGCGKSTIMDILSGLLTIPNGELAVDGLKIDQTNSAEWQRNIGYVSQDIVLMNDSVLNNIVSKGTDTEFNEKLLETVSKLTALDKVVNDELPQKWETNVGTRGGSLSGGQRQRIALARALYKQPSLLLLDEATSALDVDSEKIITDTLMQLKGSVTIVVITHKPESLVGCDKIYEVIDGALREKNDLMSQTVTF